MRKLLLASAAMLGATGWRWRKHRAPTPDTGMMMMPGIGAAIKRVRRHERGRQPGHVYWGGGYNKLAVPAPARSLSIWRKVEVDMIAQWTTNNQTAGVTGVPAGKTIRWRSARSCALSGVDGMAPTASAMALRRVRENFPAARRRHPGAVGGSREAPIRPVRRVRPPCVQPTSQRLRRHRAVR